MTTIGLLSLSTTFRAYPFPLYSTLWYSPSRPLDRSREFGRDVPDDVANTFSPRPRSNRRQAKVQQAVVQIKPRCDD